MVVGHDHPCDGVEQVLARMGHLPVGEGDPHRHPALIISCSGGHVKYYKIRRHSSKIKFRCGVHEKFVKRGFIFHVYAEIADRNVCFHREGGYIT